MTLRRIAGNSLLWLLLRVKQVISFVSETCVQCLLKFDLFSVTS
jgi:hypothetical protein